MHELLPFVERQAIRVAVLSVPEEAAAGVMEQIRLSHLRGGLNFTAAHLRSDAQCLVHNLDIRMAIERLFCAVELASRAGADAARGGHGDTADDNYQRPALDRA
jgi:NADH/NAD ratio-sensing transcriptional regulator Rex